MFCFLNLKQCNHIICQERWTLEKVHSIHHFILHVSFEAMTIFQHSVPPFYLSLLFSVVRAQSAVLLPALGSVCPFILTPALSRFCVLNVRQISGIFCLPASLSLSLDG